MSIVLEEATVRKANDLKEEQGAVVSCAHCGEDCVDEILSLGEDRFCCAGCKTVYQILHENDLEQYYDLESTPGLTPNEGSVKRFAFLDDDSMAKRLVDFSNETHLRVTLKLPAIHCLSCVWLVENLYRLNDGVELSEVNFSRATANILINKNKLSLRELAELLSSLGYEPDIRLADLDKNEDGKEKKSKDLLLIKIAVAGFCFGNIMLFSFPAYFGLAVEKESSLFHTFSWLNFFLSLPVVFFAGSDYAQSAKNFFQRRVVTLDLPVFIGIVALFLQSAYLLFSGEGEGYWDSLAGLIFFLLLGRFFQRKTYDTLSFDRDYKSFFPVWATLLKDGEEQAAPIDQLVTGQRILIRNEELVPADAVLISGEANVDYSFVTGESHPVPVKLGEVIYAGARQVGGKIELETVKDPSRSYLTGLWNNPQFRKDKAKGIRSLSDKLAGSFTLVVLLAAVIASLIWFFIDPSKSLGVFVSVVIVACPCALALSAPFTLGFATRILGRRGLYLKNSGLIEVMAEVSDIVFDKTGTLTDRHQAKIAFEADNDLSDEELSLIRSAVAQSTHPLSRQLYKHLSQVDLVDGDFEELSGKGLIFKAKGQSLRLGSAKWLSTNAETEQRTQVLVEFNGALKGRFVFSNVYRSGISAMINRLGLWKSHLLSGDGQSERSVLEKAFPSQTELRFQQSPADKMTYVEALKEKKETVLMIGDGLNDAGALRSADCGFSVAEDLSAFYPACDGIFKADSLVDLDRCLRFSKSVITIIRISFTISILYNLTGFVFAATGILSPIVSAVLMPLSSISIVIISALGSSFAEWRIYRNKESL